MLTPQDAHKIMMAATQASGMSAKIDEALRTHIATTLFKIAMTFSVGDNKEVAQYLCDAYRKIGWEVSLQDVGSDRAYSPSTCYVLRFTLPPLKERP